MDSERRKELRHSLKSVDYPLNRFAVSVQLDTIVLEEVTCKNVGSVRIPLKQEVSFLFCSLIQVQPKFNVYSLLSTFNRMF